MRRYELAARISRLRGAEGKVTAQAAEGLPLCLSEGLRCHVVPPALRGPRELVVERVESLGPHRCVLTLHGVDSAKKAQRLLGRYLLAPLEELGLTARELPGALLGRSVVDERFGVLGTICDLLETPAHDVWVVEGAHGEVLVPAVDAFVLEFPEDASAPIRTRVPDGLLDGALGS